MSKVIIELRPHKTEKEICGFLGYLQWISDVNISSDSWEKSFQVMEKER